MKKLLIMINLIFFTGCVSINRHVMYEITCEQCVTSYGRGDKINLKINKSLKVEPCKKVYQNQINTLSDL